MDGDFQIWTEGISMDSSDFGGTIPYIPSLDFTTGGTCHLWTATPLLPSTSLPAPRRRRLYIDDSMNIIAMFNQSILAPSVRPLTYG